MVSHFKDSFVHAPHSRDRLRVTRDMMMLALTYHQVMPSFLDYLFSFGEQEFDQDFHFSGIHFESRLSAANRSLSVPQLCRSGREIQLCYSLRSVEPSKGQKSWPWSVRSTATYHSFDFESGRANWVMLKGSESMKKRIMAEMDPRQKPERLSLETLGSTFSYSLKTHLVSCYWAGENWRWYINYMEEAVQTITRRTLSLDVTKVQSIQTTMSEKQPVSQDDDFSWDDLQRIQYIEEKANETLLVMKLNTKVMTELKAQYISILESDDCPGALKEGSQGEVTKFSNAIANIVNDLQVQQSRVETLLRLLSDRKALVGSHTLRSMAAKLTLIAIWHT
jgi:hypothetical protein